MQGSAMQVDTGQLQEDNSASEEEIEGGPAGTHGRSLATPPGLPAGIQRVEINDSSSDEGRYVAEARYAGWHDPGEAGSAEASSAAPAQHEAPHDDSDEGMYAAEARQATHRQCEREPTGAQLQGPSRMGSPGEEAMAVETATDNQLTVSDASEGHSPPSPRLAAHSDTEAQFQWISRTLPDIPLEEVTAGLGAFRRPLVRQWRNFCNEVYELKNLIESYLRYRDALARTDRKLRRTERAIEHMFTSLISREAPPPPVPPQEASAAPQQQRRRHPTTGRQAYETAMAHTLAIVGGRQQEDTCALCREAIGAMQALRTFPCLHSLHHNCALDLFLHHQESKRWVRCPRCRYQLHPEDTGRQMMQRALASSLTAPSPVAQVPALTEGSGTLGVPAVPAGTNRTFAEVEDLAMRTAERVTQLRVETDRLYTQLCDTVHAIDLGKTRARRYLCGFDSVRNQIHSSSDPQAQAALQYSTFSHMAHVEMHKIDSVLIAVQVD